MDVKSIDLEELGIKKIRFSNFFGIRFGKRMVLFSPGKQEHVTFEMNGSKFNIHITKEPFHKGPRKKVFEMDMDLPKEKYATLEKEMISISLWFSKQALISDPQALTKTGVKAISEMPDEAALVEAGRIKKKELIVDDITFIDKTRFYYPEALWSLQPDKTYYGWKLNKEKTALNLNGFILVFGEDGQKIVYYFHQKLLGRLMWHYLMSLLPIGLSCEQKILDRINALVNVVSLLRRRFGKLSGIVDIIGEVSPIPKEVVIIYAVKSSLPLLKKKVPREIMGIKVIIKSAS